jgi:hypothetical protein
VSVRNADCISPDLSLLLMRAGDRIGCFIGMSLSKHDLDELEIDLASTANCLHRSVGI